MDITWVGKKDARRLWPSIDHFVLRALKMWLPVYRTIDLLEMVERDELQLWIITNNEEEKVYGACLTCIESYPLANVLKLFLLGGHKMKDWIDIYTSKMEEFAKAENCKFLTASGRRGWSKMPGAFESAVITTKVLA